MTDQDDMTKVDIEESELLSFILAEHRSSIGFEFDADLISQRERATNYAKGLMYDVPALANRSKAVDTAIADAIETALADIVPIFVDGEDVIVFRPRSQEDEEQAQQETDYVNYVFFEENDGYSILRNYIRDALLLKTGMITWWWEECNPDPQTYDAKNQMEVAMLVNGLGPDDVEVTICDDMGPNGEQLYDVKVLKPKGYSNGRLKIEAFDPNDFTIARDAKSIEGATYCARRSRPRVQDLLAMGIDRELVDMLPTWGIQQYHNAAQLAQDTVSESYMAVNASQGDLRQVLVIEHYIRLYDEEKERSQLYQVLTNEYASIVLRAQKVNRINIAAGGPYPQPHRFYAQSLADKLIEVQRIKTALTRMTLDSGYFAINQRPIVNMNATNDQTLNDLLNNVPGAVIRVDGSPSDSVQMAGGAALNFDPLQHLEYFSVVGEQRTGIVRNSQGLNPDTLHDTATGAMALMSNSLKRVRMIARNLAEGIRDAMLGIHATLCENATEGARARLRGKWVEVNPSQWERRNDMTIEIGMGAADHQHELLVGQQLGAVLEQLVAAQGGPDGPLVQPKNLYNAAIDVVKALGKKQPERYVSDPDQYQPKGPPPPDPKMLEMQAKQEEAKARFELDAQKAQHDAQMKEHVSQVDYELGIQKMQLEAQLKREQLEAEMQIKREQMAAEFALKREQMAAEFALKERQQARETALNVRQQDADADLRSAEIDSRTEFGGDSV